MKQETMQSKISDLLANKNPKFRNGGIHELMSPKQSSQLFNTLHREYSVCRMNISKIDENTRRLVASDWEQNFVINAIFTVY